MAHPVYFFHKLNLIKSYTQLRKEEGTNTIKDYSCESVTIAF